MAVKLPDLLRQLDRKGYMLVNGGNDAPIGICDKQRTVNPETGKRQRIHHGMMDKRQLNHILATSIDPVHAAQRFINIVVHKITETDAYTTIVEQKVMEALERLGIGAEALKQVTKPATPAKPELDTKTPAKAEPDPVKATDENPKTIIVKPEQKTEFFGSQEEKKGPAPVASALPILNMTEEQLNAYAKRLVIKDLEADPDSPRKPDGSLRLQGVAAKIRAKIRVLRDTAIAERDFPKLRQVSPRAKVPTGPVEISITSLDKSSAADDEAEVAKIAAANFDPNV